MTMDALREFRTTKADAFYDLLTSQQVTPEKAETVVHALIDISESMEKIYSRLIPSILSVPHANSDLFEERLWDMRSEFRHVDYHIRDAGLAEWEW